MSKQKEIKEKIDKLNYYNKLYDEGRPAISDKEYDALYFELKALEEETGIIYPNSPTQSILYEVVNGLEKVEHNHDMLSLDKTKDFNKIKQFIGDNSFVAMEKMDGLTVSLTYVDGILKRAESRGDGHRGELILANARVVNSIPQSIPIKDEVIVDGEMISTYEDFEKFNQDYKNPRNFASGSIRLLDSSECAKRHLTFVAWDYINCKEELFSTRLELLSQMGFIVVPYEVDNWDCVETLKMKAEENSYPIDGLVFKFNNIEYGLSKGKTAHHANNAIAMKFYDEIYPTTLKDIEWGCGRGDIITPVAIFDTIEFDTEVSRASLHNLSIINSIFGDDGPRSGQTIYVSKRNMIIPCVESADPYPEGEKIEIPSICPCCGSATAREADNESEFLICPNSQCPGKIINRIDYFAGKKGLDIKGLSEATIEKLIEWGWLNSCADIFTLNSYRNEWIKKPGFGLKSVDNILAAIEKSENCTLDKFICALGIPLIGATASKQLAKVFKNWNIFIEAVENGYKFYQIAGFGREMSQAITTFDFAEARFIAHNFIIFKENKDEKTSLLEGKVYAITGKLYEMTREQLKDKIEQLGGKVTSAVSKKTTALICNEEETTSTKAVKAKELGIPIITEKYFFTQLEN